MLGISNFRPDGDSCRSVSMRPAGRQAAQWNEYHERRGRKGVSEVVMEMSGSYIAPYITRLKNQGQPHNSLRGAQIRLCAWPPHAYRWDRLTLQKRW